MKKLRSLMTAVAAAVALTALAGCTTASGGGSADSDGPIGTPKGTGKAITVWIMDGDLSEGVIAEAKKQFQDATGATADVQIQEWDGITTKLTTALAQSGAPDVVDLGNTDVPVYAASGALRDLSGWRSELADGQTWLAGLEKPAVVDGKLYAAPLFAGNRTVVYDKKVWADAGVTEPPTAYDELLADLDKVKAANTAPTFSAFYMPGQNWYGGMQWVWDAGGALATEKGGTWSGAIDSAAAVKGLTAWKDFQNTYSTTASQDLFVDKPLPRDLLAQGQTSATLMTSGDLGNVLKSAPELADRLGSFPLPSTTAGKTQPVFLGGSDLAIPAKSKNPKLAAYFLKLVTSAKFQKEQVFGVDGWEPNSVELLDQVSGDVDELHRAFFAAAKSSRPTPASPGWATIEGDGTAQTLFADIATGRATPSAAAKAFAQHLDEALNAQQ